MKRLTPQQQDKACKALMDGPIPLKQLDMSRPFVYDRAYGAFYVASGYHQAAMSLLLAFHQGESDGIDVARTMGLEYGDGTADYWLQHCPGAAYRSSLRRMIYAARRDGLSLDEMRTFGNVVYIYEPPPRFQ